MTFSISLLVITCQIVVITLLLHSICSNKNISKSLLRTVDKLIGQLLEPVNAALAFLGSGMTLASLQVSLEAQIKYMANGIGNIVRYHPQ